MLCLWSAKGGSGCTVTSIAIGLMAAHEDETLLVDLGGDVGLTLGILSDERTSAPDGEWHEPEAPEPFPADGQIPDGPAAAVVRSRPGWGIAGWLQAPSPPPDALARFERPLASGLSLLPWGATGEDILADRPPLAQISERVTILARLLADDGRRVVVDLGVGPGGVPWWQEPFLDLAQLSLLVTRPCYLSLSRAARQPRPDGVVVIDEPGRALTVADVAAALDVPVLASLPHDPAVARAVDSGLLLRRLPRSLRGLTDVVAGSRLPW